jgi:hypothetical protein
MSGDFYRVDPSLPLGTQIKYINEMILKLAGKYEQASFDEKELTALYSALGSGYPRSYLRNQAIGSAIGTYSNWAHYKAEDAYSIWKIQPTNYAYSVNNVLLMNNKVVENVGEANALTTQFDNVFTYDQTSGVGYTDVTSDISTEGSNEVTAIEAIGDYLYVGDAATFNGIAFEFLTVGSNYTLVVEYWDGDSWEALGEAESLVDNTNDFASNGAITFTAPGDWATTAVNSTTKYWIRISTTTTPVTAVEIYYCTSGDSVEGLLSMSSSELLNQEWKFCTYSGYIYVTIPNAGATAYEGIDFITSSSSATNKQNFFIYNQPFQMDYLSS